MITNKEMRPHFCFYAHGVHFWSGCWRYWAVLSTYFVFGQYNLNLFLWDIIVSFVSDWKFIIMKSRRRNLGTEHFGWNPSSEIVFRQISSFKSIAETEKNMMTVTSKITERLQSFLCCCVRLFPPWRQNENICQTLFLT